MASVADYDSDARTSMIYRLGELFCGPGGIALGAHAAADSVSGVTVRHAWANDYDADTCATYRRNIPGASEASVIHGDVRALDLARLPPIDGLAFGFPCNDFSIVGEHRGIDGNFGALYSYGVSALAIHRPQWFVAENVGGIRSSNEGTAFARILSEMRETGYAIVPHLYRFEQYGLPQKRHRVLIVGIREDLGLSFRVPSPSEYAGRDVSARTALERPPIAADAPNNERTRQSATVVERLGHINPGQNAFNADIPEHLRLNVVGATISQIYRRLEADKPAYTITGSGGGGTHVYHWEEPRALTNRERARLQGFPDSFVFEGSKESVRKQVGMAVPAQGAKVVFEALFKTLAGIEYASTESNLQHLVRTASSEDAEDGLAS